jgi:hypothetical protein
MNGRTPATALIERLLNAQEQKEEQSMKNRATKQAA